MKRRKVRRRRKTGLPPLAQLSMRVAALEDLFRPWNAELRNEITRTTALKQRIENIEAMLTSYADDRFNRALTRTVIEAMSGRHKYIMRKKGEK